MKLPKRPHHLKGAGRKPSAFAGWGKPNAKPKPKKKINRAEPKGFN